MIEWILRRFFAVAFPLFFLLGAFPAQAQIVISEILASNRFTLWDEDGTSSDWVELVNTGNQPESLEGYGLTDSAKNPFRWIFPQVILQPGQYLVVWCSSKNRVTTVPGNVFIHTNFSLSGAGEMIQLTNPDGIVIDRLTFPIQDEDRSYGRKVLEPMADGVYFLIPTPKAPNDIEATSLERLEPFPIVEPESGRYTESFLINATINLPFQNIDLRYTLDGSEPTWEHDVLEGPLAIRSDTILKIAAFQTRISEENGFQKVTVPRVSHVTTRSYFLNPICFKLDLPVISLSMKPQDFIDLQEHGIEHGRKFEKPAHFSIFSSDFQELVSQGLGIRVHGSGGRHTLVESKNSYRTYFRSEYGEGSLKLPLFDDTPITSFEQLVLRSNNVDQIDIGESMIRDQIVREIHGSLGQPFAHGTWFNLFINREYRGIYNVVERINEDFFKNYFPNQGQPWDVLFIDTPIDGSTNDWTYFLRDIQIRDFTKSENYEWLLQKIDLENFASYLFMELWSNNWDWPHNNWSAAKEKRADAKWYFTLWDVEAGLTEPLTTSFLTFSQKTMYPIVKIFVALAKNPSFQEYFLNYIRERLTSEITPEKILKIVEFHEKKVVLDIPEESLRSEYPNLQASWQRRVDKIKKFVVERNEPFWLDALALPTWTIPRIKSFSPSVYQLGSLEPITLQGFGFTPNTVVKFNNIPAETIEFESSVALKVIPPDGVLGLTEIRVENPGLGEAGFTASDLIDLKERNIFLRGDVTADGRRSVTDAVMILSQLYREALPENKICLNSMDVDGSGTIDYTDGIVLLDLMFLNGRLDLMPAPNLHCGTNASPVDPMSCIGPTICD